MRLLNNCAYNISNKAMKQNNGTNINKTYISTVPKYSDKYKDVLERAALSKQPLKTVKKDLFFYRVRSIGVGAFSFVYLVQEQTCGALLAQKSISKKAIRPQLLTQIKMHMALSHPNIVTLYHIYSEDDYIQLIMEYAGDSLFTLKKNNKLPNLLKDSFVFDILGQLLQAVRYLHMKDIVHADIKLQNILYEQGVVKLCDFGFAHLSTAFSQKKQKQIVGTLEYSDPEYLQGRHSQKQRDIWAIGIVCYELAIGRNPFDHMAQNQKWNTMLSIRSIDLEYLQVSQNVKQFLQMTLCPIEKRATVTQLLNLRVFDTQKGIQKGQNWEISHFWGYS